MNKKLLMAFVLVGGMALAQTSGGSAGSTSSPDQSQNPQATQPSSPNQQQPTSPSDQSNPNNQSTATSSTGQETVVRGCLKQSGGNWIVSQNGQDITLNGDSSMLKPHDGHQVEVHGTQSGGSLQVTSINMISDSCTGSNPTAMSGTSASPSSAATSTDQNAPS
ncbi:MAG TPA: hypothetical protein VKD65_08645, partial [Candidatus Angelobacter sp.]|nr:hypothetical protein [Candidatus Angelobacter sp.]